MLNALPDIFRPTSHVDFAELKRVSASNGNNDARFAIAPASSVFPVLIRRYSRLSNAFILDVTNGGSDDVTVILLSR